MVKVNTCSQGKSVLLCRCRLSSRLYRAQRSQPWAAAVGFSAFRGDLRVPPPLLSTLVCTHVGQRCLISSSRSVGVCLDRGQSNVSSLSLQALCYPLRAGTFFYHRVQAHQPLQVKKDHTCHSVC